MQKIPKSLEEAITQLFDDRENIITNTGELFCHMEETSSPVLFTCKTNLELLKSTETFIQMWYTIINLCLRFDIDIQNTLKYSNFHFDFEKSAHNTVRNFFPNCKIMACRFHLGQSWFRKIQRDIETIFYSWIFTFGSPTDNFKFTDYKLNNISSDAAFSPILWATEPSTEARTTNGPESFHSHYSAHIKQQNINKPRKEQEENIVFIINTWEKYKSNEISLNDYLLTLGPRFCVKKL
ncbi:hypothetical protein AGLY_004410 [Aphis glycines]|uniref:MULE transposase domain-containing protein n=1 Tax=Aphis glycines TaxID=307491 RepID=A0A6G0TY52_APHGL|nr:hypothetical protein AGLY_004410 [Aphis glycines]